MKFLDTVAAIVQTIYTGFFAWMPLSLRILFGVLLALSLIVMIVKVIGMVLDAIPFL